MSMPHGRSRRSSAIIVAGFLIFFGLVLAAALSQSSVPLRESASRDRSSPDAVHNRVVPALGLNNMESVYSEMSPSMTELFSLQDLLQAEQSAEGTRGKITNVEIVEPPSIRTEPGWDSRWAEAKLRITRATGTRIYLVRYILENGNWYLFGTAEL